WADVLRGVVVRSTRRLCIDPLFHRSLESVERCVKAFAQGLRTAQRVLQWAIETFVCSESLIEHAAARLRASRRGKTLERRVHAAQRRVITEPLPDLALEAEAERVVIAPRSKRFAPRRRRVVIDIEIVIEHHRVIAQGTFTRDEPTLDVALHCFGFALPRRTE